MSFKTYNDVGNLPSTFSKYFGKTDIPALKKLFENYTDSGVIVAVQDRNNLGEIFEGHVEIENEEIYRLVNPMSPESEREKLKLRYSDLEKLFIQIND